MKGNLKIIQKSLNLTSFKREVEKAAEGVYVDSPLNRKLGRVGMPYKKGDGEKGDKENDKDENNSKNFYENIDKEISNKKEELDKVIKEDKIIRDKNKGKDHFSFNNSIKETSGKIYKLENDLRGLENKKNYNSLKIINESSVLKGIKGEKLQKLVESTKLNISKDITEEAKLQKVVESYIKSSDLKGSNKEIANSLEKIIEDALADYVSNEDFNLNNFKLNDKSTFPSKDTLKNLSKDKLNSFRKEIERQLNIGKNSYNSIYKENSNKLFNSIFKINNKELK